MTRENIPERPDASAAPPLESPPDLIAPIRDLVHDRNSLAVRSSVFAAPADVCSARFSSSNFAEPTDLTPEEATELLRLLETSTLFHTPATQSAASADNKIPIATARAPSTRKKSGRKKSLGSRTGKMRNPSRERLQSELAHLRRKTVELETQLSNLQTQRRSRVNFDTGTIRAVAKVWRRIADRQAEGRDRSERENKRLKEVLEGQIALVKRLEQMLKKQPDVTVRSESFGGCKLLTAAEDMSGMYELFLSELDGLHAQMDGVFQQTGLETSVDDSFRHAYVKTRSGPDDQEELYAELQDVTVIPFDLERASSAMWHAVRRQYRKNSYHSYEGVMERPDNTIAMKYRTQCHRSGVEIWLDATLVMRRYVERDQLAFVWRSVSHAVGELSGMYTDETGWSVLKRIPPDSEISLSGCVMHNCVHVVPKRMDYASGLQQDDIGLLTNLVIDSYEDDVIALSAMTEDMLLQDGVASSMFAGCAG